MAESSGPVFQGEAFLHFTQICLQDFVIRGQNMKNQYLLFEIRSIATDTEEKVAKHLTDQCSLGIDFLMRIPGGIENGRTAHIQNPSDRSSKSKKQKKRTAPFAGNRPFLISAMKGI